MMPRRTAKLRGRASHATANHIGQDLMIMTLAVLCAFLTVVLVFSLLQLNGWREARQGVEGLRFAAEEVNDEAAGGNPVQQEVKSGDVKVEIEKFAGYAFLGQEEVKLMRFSLAASEQNAQLRELIFSLDGYARPRDLKNLQLYFEGKFMAEVPFFEGKGVFSNLAIALPAGEKMAFEVKGKVSEEAFSGDRIQLGFKDANAFSIRTDDSTLLTVEGEFPMWGGNISVIGNKRG